MAIININEYVPVIVNQEFDWFPKDVVTADELNKIFDSFKTQGNYTAEALTTVIEKINFNYSELRRDVDALTAGTVPDGAVTTEKLADGAVTYAKLNEDVTQKFDTLNSTTEALQNTHNTDMANIQNAINNVFYYIRQLHNINPVSSKTCVWNVDTSADETYLIPEDGNYQIVSIGAGGIPDTTSGPFIAHTTSSSYGYYARQNVENGYIFPTTHNYSCIIYHTPEYILNNTYAFRSIPEGGNGAVAYGNIALKANDVIRIQRVTTSNPANTIISINGVVAGVFRDAYKSQGGYAEHYDSTLFTTYKQGYTGRSCTYPTDAAEIPAVTQALYNETVSTYFSQYLPQNPGLDIDITPPSGQQKLQHSLQNNTILASTSANNGLSRFRLAGKVGAGFGLLTDVYKWGCVTSWDKRYEQSGYWVDWCSSGGLYVPTIGLGTPALLTVDRHTSGPHDFLDAHVLDFQHYPRQAAVFINKID